MLGCRSRFAARPFGWSDLDSLLELADGPGPCPISIPKPVRDALGPRIPVSKNRPSSEFPDLTVVRRIFNCFDGHGLVGALGGSGLLAALGLTQVVHDWDITTDSAASIVEVALADTGFPYESKVAGDGTFASTAPFIVDAASHG